MSEKNHNSKRHIHSIVALSIINLNVYQQRKDKNNVVHIYLEYFSELKEQNKAIFFLVSSNIYLEIVIQSEVRERQINAI